MWIDVRQDPINSISVLGLTTPKIDFGAQFMCSVEKKLIFAKPPELVELHDGLDRGQKIEPFTVRIQGAARAAPSKPQVAHRLALTASP
jgi:hypothetical protein